MYQRFNGLDHYLAVMDFAKKTKTEHVEDSDLRPLTQRSFPRASHFWADSYGLKIHEQDYLREVNAA